MVMFLSCIHALHERYLMFIYVYIPTLSDICCVFDWMCDVFKDAYVVAIFDACVCSHVFGAVKMTFVCRNAAPTLVH